MSNPITRTPETHSQADIPRRTEWRRSLGIGIWGLGLFLVSCGSAPPLANTAPSARSLGEALLDGLARRDRVALERLALSEQEFRDHVWEYLPAARPERNLPFSYVWGDLRQKSRASLGQTLTSHGGRRYALGTVEFEGVTDYGPYRVHRQATFRVRGVSRQHDESIRVIGSMIEKDGVWKVFSYAVDD